MYSDANDNVIFISSEYIAILPLLAHRLDVLVLGFVICLDVKNILAKQRTDARRAFMASSEKYEQEVKVSKIFAELKDGFKKVDATVRRQQAAEHPQRPHRPHAGGQDVSLS